MMILPSLIDAIVARALEEDLAGGDLTGQTCIEESATATADVSLPPRPRVVMWPWVSMP